MSTDNPTQVTSERDEPEVSAPPQMETSPVAVTTEEIANNWAEFLHARQKAKQKKH